MIRSCCRMRDTSLATFFSPYPYRLYFFAAAQSAAADNGPHRYCGTRPPCPAPYARRRPRRRKRPQHDARRYEKPDDMQAMLRHASLREATAIPLHKNSNCFKYMQQICK